MVLEGVEGILMRRRLLDFLLLMLFILGGVTVFVFPALAIESVCY